MPESDIERLQREAKSWDSMAASHSLMADHALACGRYKSEERHNKAATEANAHAAEARSKLRELENASNT